VEIAHLGKAKFEGYPAIIGIINMTLTSRLYILSAIDWKEIEGLKEYMSDSFTNYNYVGNTKVSVSIKKPYANKCTLSEIFLTEILKSFSVF